MDIFVAVIYLASLFVLWRLLAGALELLRGLAAYDVNQIQEVLKLLNAMAEVAKANGATAIRIEVAAEKVADDLKASEQRADATTEKAHGAAADAAAKSE